jgi:hypothetical protein
MLYVKGRPETAVRRGSENLSLKKNESSDGSVGGRRLADASFSSFGIGEVENLDDEKAGGAGLRILMNPQGE